MRQDLREASELGGTPPAGAQPISGAPSPAKTLLARFDVYGAPAPQGSKKFVGIAKSTGRGILVESSKKVKPWRQDVKAAAIAHIADHWALNPIGVGPVFPLDGALSVRMIFTLPKPASAPKRKRLYAMRKPDLSKLARSTEDALTDSGLIADDARICEYQRLAKVFPHEDPEALSSPGCVIEIRRYGDG